jgi:tRNA(fMet)-specific endonuclease VapC
MTLYMLDTNSVSYLIRGNAEIASRLQEVSMAALGVSAITKAELMFGLARRPEATRLQLVVREFLRRVDVLPWDDAVAEGYGALKAQMTAQGLILAPLDLLIAAHALNQRRVLVTSDHSFNLVPGLKIEDWTLAGS